MECCGIFTKIFTGVAITLLVMIFILNIFIVQDSDEFGRLPKGQQKTLCDEAEMFYGWCQNMSFTDDECRRSMMETMPEIFNITKNSAEGAFFECIVK